MGWTKNHHTLEVFVVGKWRTMGYWTEKQIARLKWVSEVTRRIKVNGGVPADCDVQYTKL